MFLFGVFGNMHSIVITSFTGKFSDKEQSVRYMALINAAGMIGSFLCPFLFALSQKLTDGSIASGFKVNGFESIALGLFCFVVSRNFD